MQKGFIQLIAIAIISAFLAAGVSILYQQSYPSIIEPEIPGILGVNTAVGGKVYTLSGAGISSSATSIPLTSFQIAGGTQPLLMADFGDLGCGTIQPGNSTKQEFISFTGVTQNSDDTATLTGVTRGLKPIPDYTASTTLQTAHAGGTTFVISNSPPCFYEGYAQITQNEVITGLFTFNTWLPSSTLTPTSSLQFATKGYADNVIAGGAATSSETLGGKVRLATQNQMASSTDDGVDDPAALYSKYSTSTQPIGCGTNCKYIPITQNNGQLDPTFINQQTLTLGTTTVNASSTFIGQVNIASSTTINAIKYTWPTNTTIASSSVLTMTTATGTVAWLAPEFGLIGEAVLNAANATLQVDFPARQDLHVVIDVLNNTTDVTVIRFNGDTGSNYTSYIC